MSPAIPYLTLPDLVILDAGALGGGFPPAPFAVKPFGTLVAMGVYLGAYLAVRQGRRLGFDEKTLVSFMVWVGVGGFVGGHVFDTLFYFPSRVMEDPLSLIRVWEGLSSFGGFFGAALGAILWKWKTNSVLLPYMDVVGSAFPVGWVLGRTGCSLAHDHPGMFSDAFLAVQYPDGARFDLGLYEMLLTVPLAVGFLILRRRPRPWGFYMGMMTVYYAPYRFALDFLRARDLRVSDERYLDLTPAQWACMLMFAYGAVTLFRAFESAGEPSAWAVPQVPPAGRRRASGP